MVWFDRLLGGKRRWTAADSAEKEFAHSLQQEDDFLTRAVEASSDRVLRVMAEKSDDELVRFGFRLDLDELQFVRDVINDCQEERKKRYEADAAIAKRMEAWVAKK